MLKNKLNVGIDQRDYIDSLKESLLNQIPPAIKIRIIMLICIKEYCASADIANRIPKDFAYHCVTQRFGDPNTLMLDELAEIPTWLATNFVLE
jgi:hypothetical protein